MHNTFSKPKEIANEINLQMDRFIPVLFPLGVVLGFILPGVFILLQPYVLLLFAMMTLSGALKLKVAEFGTTIRNPLPIAAAFVSSYILMPLFALLVSSFIFAGDNDTITGFILLFCGPIAVSSFIWVSIYRGSKALSLTLILLGTILAPITVPGTLSILMGARVALDMSGVAVSLLLMVVVPTIIGVTLNETSRGKIPSLVCPYLNPVSKICLMLVIAANTSSVATTIRLDDPTIWIIAVVCILLAIINFLLAKLAAIMCRCSTENSIALFFSGSLRNIASVATIAVTFFSQATVLPTLIMIVFQHLLSALMAKLLIKKGNEP